jgi:hypothetical protein
MAKFSHPRPQRCGSTLRSSGAQGSSEKAIESSKEVKMANTRLSLHTEDTLGGLHMNDDMGTSITDTIDKVAGESSLLTRLRLRKTRGREAIKLAETALVEIMAAKRRTFIAAVGLAEDHARKLLLSESMRNTEAVEREIAKTITDALSNFEKLIVEREQAAYMIEFERIASAQEMRDTGRMSDRRYEQLVVGIEESTDKVVQGVRETTREILVNLRHRFNAALRQVGGAS